MSWMTAQAACERLGIKRQTLYAYVSRGRLSSKPDPDDPRASLFSLGDVEALARRSAAGRSRRSVAAGAMRWGDGVLESRIATVQGGRLIYRGEDAIAWSAEATLEATAALLRGDPQQPGQPSHPHAAQAGPPQAGRDPKTRALAWLAARAATDQAALGRSAQALSGEADELLAGFAQAVAGQPRHKSCHEDLSRLWDLPPARGELIRRVLVLVADHELNPSTFAARVAASTGASLAAAALAGLSTLTGPRHGEAAARSFDFLEMTERLGPREAVAALRARAQSLPGTGHQLYPDGDPRAQTILAMLGPTPRLREAIAILEAETGHKPNLDLALAALSRQLLLPADAPFALFATGRMAGWLAHAIEQVGSGELIRPRATYA
jgi:citrate synthase